MFRNLSREIFSSHEVKLATDVSYVSLEAQGTGLLRNFNLLLPFHSSQMMSSQKSQSFTLWLTCKKVASSPIALQHRESVFCFCDQIQCVLMILCLQVYFTYRQEDVKYRAVLCVCSFSVLVKEIS